MGREARLSPELPERFARLYDYQTGKFATPLNPQGIADIDALVELAIRTYPDELPSFDSCKSNNHHVYWTERDWKRYAASQPWPQNETIHTFRNSTPQIAYVPVFLHPWIEEVMHPPPAPPMEVMRRRNAAWSVATILLRSAIMLDEARDDYDRKKNSTRLVLGWITGITPLSKRSAQEIEERVNREYWLSELNDRLEGWKSLRKIISNVPPEDRIITEARLAEVRELGRRIKHDAMVPKSLTA